MLTRFAIDLLPTFDRFDGRFDFKNIREDSTIHVFAHGQTVVRKNGGSNIQQVGTVDDMVLLDVGSRRDKDPIFAVLFRRPRRFIG